MERPGSLNGSQHVIEIAGSSDASTSTATHHNSNFNGTDVTVHEERVTGARTPLSHPSVSVASLSNGSNSRNSSFMRRGDTRRNRSPVHSGLWISIELVLLVSQIVASIVVLSLSRHERPRTPLFQWIIGYASGCVATLPLLYWRYYHHNHTREQDSSQSRQTSPRINDPSGTLLFSSRTSGGEDGQVVASSRSNQASVLMNRRMKTLVEYFKISLDCFFAVWFVVGNVWIFGGHSSADEAPNLYRLCIVFLAFSCIGYAMPFILCSTICCCLPCIISILGVREDMSQNRGATSESINALPTYKFKMKKNKRNGEGNSTEGGVVAAGTEKERVISGEDAVCCICLAKYENNDELRELPCSHLFHKDCVDKWLKINSLCPLCKNDVGENLTGLVSSEDASQHRSESRIENGLANTSL
ncbi:E3 ubiquitin-protein ligase At1g63170 [Vigna unguiculata]|uniref:E3 ubiquitin-protein ligase At1g63170 n=1 Tax=Vigna unguiculata TaxID=3917 RepID=UPI001015D89F|nr:E3 ubiquitin-protein ligase At1g63170 [Vigna unguiculata]XP_027940281.1 E3 ubiquitin-protein ligase At1g63170 [Vigna unguiculata]XP_027940282.1 E3 ubiquitin-protein ligase At1g63170 [Vigna unguiculata]XP_027940283.1 E3 ubiquitin-protein ligase At1g63170 [Vigna unguiculata]